MIEIYEWVNLRQLGKHFGVSSHVVGRWLVECGLRTDKKKPSKEAFDGGYVSTADTNRGSGYYYVWHRKNTIAALVAAGHVEV